jgi:hypothetical protein
MAALATLIAAFLVAPHQGAPADVPKSHWAHGAVDTLFQEGLLKGYPAQKPFGLDNSIKQDLSKLRTWMTEWKAEGWLVGYPDGLSGRPQEPSNWELAVALHAAISNLAGIRKSGGNVSDFAEATPRLSKAISMLNTELTKLGVDVQWMFSVLNDLRDGSNRPFHGNRCHLQP